MSSTLLAVFKINPVAFLLLYVLARCLSMVLLGDETLTDKLVFLVLGGAIYLVALVFEAWRVATEEELEEAAWKGRLGSGCMHAYPVQPW